MMRLVVGLGWWALVNLLIAAFIVVLSVIEEFWRQLRGRWAAARLIRSVERSRG